MAIYNCQTLCRFPEQSFQLASCFNKQKPVHGLSVGLGLQNNGHLPGHQLVSGDILELGHVEEKMEIQMVMRPQWWFLIVNVCFANIPELSL